MTMYNNKVYAAWSAVAVTVISGCASLQVRSEYSPDASFARLDTYEWVERPAVTGGDPAVNSPLLERHIQAAVGAELSRMGYREVTSGTPHFRVTYTISTDERSRVVGSYGYARPYGYRGYYAHSRLYGAYGYRGYGYAGFGSRGVGQIYQYLEGTLVLDIIDTRTDDVIWRGWASKSLRRNPSPAAVRMYVDQAVTEILERFPPQR